MSLLYWLWSQVTTIEARDVLGALASLVATFFGAWAAFRFESRTRSRDEDARKLAAVNRALLNLFFMWNTLKQYQLEVIDPHRDRDDAWLNMAVPPPFPEGVVASFDIDALAFLLQSGRPMMLASLVLEEQRFATVVLMIEKRNSLLVNEVFPRCAAAGLSVGGDVLEELLYKLLPVDVVHQLKIYTKGIIDLVDRDLGTLRQNFVDLRAHYISAASGGKPINVDFDSVSEAQST